MFKLIGEFVKTSTRAVLVKNISLGILEKGSTETENSICECDENGENCKASFCTEVDYALANVIVNKRSNMLKVIAISNVKGRWRTKVDRAEISNGEAVDKNQMVTWATSLTVPCSERGYKVSYI